MENCHHRNGGRMNRFLLITGLLAVSASGYAGFEQKDQGARQAGAGNAEAARGFSAWTLFANPAGLTTLDQPELAVSAFRPFGLKELQTMSLAAVLPSENWTAGIGACFSGNELYRESQFLAGFGYRLVPDFSAGLTAKFDHASIEGYGNAGTVELDAGLQSVVMDGLTAGVTVFNLTRAEIGHSHEPLPSGWRAGLSAWILGKALISGEIYHQTGFPSDLRAGLEIPLTHQVILRTGMQSATGLVTAGAGVEFWGAGLDYAFQSHPDLGSTHQISIGISLGTGENNRFPETAMSWQEPNSPKPAASRKPARKMEPVYLNRATVAELEALPGISRTQAEQIVAMRENRNGFVSVDELLGIDGMTEEKLKRLKPWLLLD